MGKVFNGGLWAIVRTEYLYSPFAGSCPEILYQEQVIEWSLSGDHVNCFCVGIFYESAGRVKYPYQKQ